METEARGFSKNAIFAMLQVVISTFIIFIIYRYLVRELGIDMLGLWALLLAVTSIANLGGLGLSGGLVKYVAEHMERSDSAAAASTVETILLTLAVVVAAISIFGWIISYYLFELVVPAYVLADARELLPFGFFALWLNAIGAAVHSALDGCCRADLRSISTLASQPVLLMLVLSLTPELRLKGLAIAQIIQFIFWIIIGWIMLRFQIISLPIIPYRWSTREFSIIWRYGLSFQLTTVLQLLTDFFAKFFISYFGGLSNLGTFELANRLVTQVRAVPTAASQVITPLYAKFNLSNPSIMAEMYTEQLRQSALFGSIVFAMTIACSPIVSLLWIGKFELTFIVLVTVFSIGWFVNSMSAPAYFVNIGVANLGANILGHLIILIILFFVTFLGVIFNEFYILASALPIALMAGAYVIIRGTINIVGVSLNATLKIFNLSKTILNIIVGIMAVFISYAWSAMQNDGGLSIYIVNGAVALLILAILNKTEIKMINLKR